MNTEKMKRLGIGQNGKFNLANQVILLHLMMLVILVILVHHVILVN